MKRFGMIAMLLLICLFGLSIQACAMGPVWTAGNTLAWNYEAAATGGYGVYYISAGGTFPAPGAANKPQATVVQPTGTPTTVTYAIAGLSLPSGAYQFCVTAFDTAGDESGCSNVVPYGLAAPTGAKTQAP